MWLENEAYDIQLELEVFNRYDGDSDDLLRASSQMEIDSDPSAWKSATEETK